VSNSVHTPPLGIAALTPLYDRVIAGMTRESAWRGRLVEHLGAKRGERILDVGSGTGTLGIAVTAAEPHCTFHGIDPDAAAVEIARRKATMAGSSAAFDVGTFVGRPASDEDRFDKVVSSLVFHQVPFAEKQRLLSAMLEWLKPGGQLLVADYGTQPSTAMRLAFRMTVQLLDGKAHTQPNADGALPVLIKAAGFTKLSTLATFDTLTGRIELIRAEKSLSTESVQ
jgi:ubiquinone/menaquinone biosynthesis C-methylase UbiE